MKLQYCLEKTKTGFIIFQVVYMDVRFFGRVLQIHETGLRVRSNNHPLIGPRSIALWGNNVKQSGMRHHCEVVYTDLMEEHIHKTLRLWSKKINWDSLDTNFGHANRLRQLNIDKQPKYSPIGKVWTV